MELFVVNRYRPDAADQPSNEQKLRDNLLKKIEERKRKINELAKEVTDAVPDNQSIPDVQEPTEPEKPKRKKKKKNKVVEEPAPPPEPSEFTVLGRDDHERRKEARMVLPDWLRNAEVVSVDLKNLSHTVDSIPGLDTNLVEKLRKNGITHFFPVQSQVIPCLLSGLHSPSMFWPRDVCVSAPTGSGKTLAFVLPIIQALQNRFVVRVRALVVLPVQDLANQVYKVFKNYCAATTLKVILLSTVMPLKEEQRHLVKKDKLAGYRSLVDIVVTTPGRLVDHLKVSEGFSLEELKYLVIDEADRVMEGVANDWLYHINVHMGLHTGATKSFQLPPICLRTFREKKRPPQKLLFSATLSQDPEKLQQLGLYHPRLFTSVVKRATSSEAQTETEQEDNHEEFIGKFTTPAELKEMFVQCSLETKPLLLIHLLKELGWRQVLCFTRSREGARRLATLLKSLAGGLFKVSIITASLTPAKRSLRLKKFATGQLAVLVCSDALARGIDIENVKYVISYDMPAFIKNHVHRVGRTGRAGKEGTAVTFVLRNELGQFKKMMAIGRKADIEEIVVEDSELEQYTEKFETALQVVKKRMNFSESLKRKRSIGIKKQQSKSQRRILKKNLATT